MLEDGNRKLSPVESYWKQWAVYAVIQEKKSCECGGRGQCPLAKTSESTPPPSSTGEMPLAAPGIRTTATTEEAPAYPGPDGGSAGAERNAEEQRLLEEFGDGPNEAPKRS